MRIVQTTVFGYDELSDKAKAKARDWYREASAGDNSFAESVINDADTIAELMGINIEQRAVKTRGGETYTEPCVLWSGFSNQGDGASFTGTFNPKAFNGAALLAHAPQDAKLHAVAANLSEAAQAIPGEWRAVISRSDPRYCHSYTMQIDIEQEADDAADVGADVEKQLLESLRAFAQWIYRQLEAEYDSSNSDDEVAETICANEYEFKADGRRACVEGV